MDLEALGPAPHSSDIEPGMNIISADFDLIMVNRANERLYGKAMVELLGKKCYREFEKRDEPCPHCPGRLSLETGGTHEAETEGRRDDGTWFSARVRTHPVQGLGDHPTAFIEVVEDITEEKRAEKLALIEANLRNSLTLAQNVRKALTLVFTEALQVESVDCGCVLLLKDVAAEQRLVVRRGLSDRCIDALTDAVDELSAGRVPAGLPDAPRALAAIPVIHRDCAAAVMVLGSQAYATIPTQLLAGLHGLAATGAAAISRIWAEQTRGDAIADLESVITYAPMAAFILNEDGRVTMWNKAAERLFGWKAAEVLKRACPFPELGDDVAAACSRPIVHEATLPRRCGGDVATRLTITAFRDVVGVASSVIVMVEDLTLARRMIELEERLAQAETRAVADPTADPAAGRVEGASAQGGRILLMEPAGPAAAELTAILSELGHEVVTCGSADAAAAAAQSAPAAVAVVELVAADGTSGLSHKAALQRTGVSVPVVVTSDSPVRGYEEHGFAAAIRRPYRLEDVREALAGAMSKVGKAPA